MTTETTEQSKYRLTIEQIRQFLPHRFPFLLVDRILEILPGTGSDGRLPGVKVGTRVVGIKSVSYNEPYFHGHFPDYAVVPGVMIIETMAQVACFSIYPWITEKFQCALLGVDAARFRKPVIPGDLLRVETVVTKNKGGLWGFQCVALVDGQKVAEADILANMVIPS